MDEKNIDQIISDYLSNDIHLNEKNIKASKLALLDTLGCVFNASLNTSATIFATDGLKDTLDNPIAYMKDIKSLKEKARFFSVLTRWFDYNDTFLAKEWAHPSDNIGTIFSYFIENNNFKVTTFIDSLIKMYEIQGCLALGTSLNKKGYDHVFYVKLASASVFSSLISNNDSEIIKRTVNNILLDGLNLRAYRHEPNVGKRKSWAAGDAVSRGIELASISEFEDEIYSEIQKDENWGFEKVFLNGENLSFGKDLNDWVIENVLFKVLYPAEFHGQSAIEASVKLSDLYKEREQEIEGIIIETHEPAIRIISNKDKLKNASDRDHSLEFMSKYQIHSYLNSIFDVITATNKYFSDQKPWELDKENPERMSTVLWVTCEVLRVVSILLQPVLIEGSKKLLDFLNVDLKKRSFNHLTSEFSLTSGVDINEPNVIFPKIDL